MIVCLRFFGSESLSALGQGGLAKALRSVGGGITISQPGSTQAGELGGAHVSCLPPAFLDIRPISHHTLHDPGPG